MKYPTADEFQQAMQQPHLSLTDFFLQNGKVECDRRNPPITDDEGDALVFRVQDMRGAKWLLHCFTSHVEGRYEQYRAINSYLSRHPHPFFAKMEYQATGISINNHTYPLLKVEDVQGCRLNEYIAANLSDRDSLSLMEARFLDIVRALDKGFIAHGDLQHQTIMVRDGQLLLTSYDRMYIAPPGGTRWIREGHPAYQHPRRANQFDAALDRFSTIVIFLAIRSLTLRPSLWSLFNNGDNLLFARKDFLDAEHSPLFRELEEIPSLSTLVSQFRRICQMPPSSIPRLTDFAAELIVRPQIQPKRVPIQPEPVPVQSSRESMDEPPEISLRELRLAELFQSLSAGTELKRRPAATKGSGQADTHAIGSKSLVWTPNEWIQRFNSSWVVREFLRALASSGRDRRIGYKAYVHYMDYSDSVLDVLEANSDVIPLELQLKAVKLIEAIDRALEAGILEVAPPPAKRRRTGDFEAWDWSERGPYDELGPSREALCGLPGSGKRS